MNQLSRFACYIRVSTDEQAREGFSIAAQRRVLEAFCVLRSASVTAFYIDEGYSAKNLNRPEMKRLLDDLRAGMFDAVVVWRIDRLTRSLKDLVVTIDELFLPRGIQLISATEPIDTSTPSGRLMLNILGSFAQNERENTAQRVRMVLNDRARQAYHVGGAPPYGFDIRDKRYVINEREAQAVRLLFRMKADGCGYGQIIDALEARGLRSRSGKPFKKATLHAMLENVRYKGTYQYNRVAAKDAEGHRNSCASKPESEIITIEHAIPEIVSPELWEEAYAATHRSRMGGAQHAKKVYLLSGLLHCGDCGCMMPIKNAGRDRHGGYYRVYSCPNCRRSINYEEADSLALRYIAHLAQTPGIVDDAARLVDSARRSAIEALRPKQHALEMQRQELAVRLANTLDYIAGMGADAPSAIGERIRRYQRDIDEIDAKLDSLRTAARPISTEYVRDNLARLRSIASQTRDVQRQELHRLIHHANVTNTTITIHLKTSPRTPTPTHAPTTTYNYADESLITVVDTIPILVFRLLGV